MDDAQVYHFYKNVFAGNPSPLTHPHTHAHNQIVTERKSLTLFSFGKSLRMIALG